MYYEALRNVDFTNLELPAAAKQKLNELSYADRRLLTQYVSRACRCTIHSKQFSAPSNIRAFCQDFMAHRLTSPDLQRCLNAQDAYNHLASSRKYIMNKNLTKRLSNVL